MLSIHTPPQDSKHKLVFPEQMKYVCDELDELKKENLELHSMVKLYVSIIKQMGDNILYLADEAEHLDRLLKFSEKRIENLSQDGY